MAPIPESDGVLRGPQKAAILLSFLPPEEAAKVLRQLTEAEVETIMREMLALRLVDESQVQRVAKEAQELLSSRVVSGGWGRVRSLLAQAFDPKWVESFLARLGEGKSEGNGASREAQLTEEMVAMLKNLPPHQIVEFIQREHPQAIALLLGYLPPSLGATVLRALPPNLRAEVALRMATLEPPPMEVLRSLQNALKNFLTTDGPFVLPFDGVQALAQILGALPKEAMQEIIDVLSQHDPSLADRVEQALFSFEDLIHLDDRSLQRLLREVDTKDLALALKGASEGVKEKILRNMSQRAATILREEIDFMGPVRIREVTAAQQKIVQLVRKLEEAGEITIPRVGEEVVI